MRSTRIPHLTTANPTILLADIAHFMALPITVMVGYDNLIFGEPIPQIGGSAGVSEKEL